MEHLRIQENEPLRHHTVLGIGGPARYYTHAVTEEGLIQSIEYAGERALSFFMLGQGSALLVSDGGYDGMVAQYANTDVILNGTLIYASAGASLDHVSRMVCTEGVSGFEWAACTAGTIGGALVTGWGEIYNGLHRFKVYDIEAMCIQWIQVDDSNREMLYTLFTSNPQWVILAAEWRGMQESHEACRERYEGYRSAQEHVFGPSRGSAIMVFKDPHIQTFPRDTSLPIDFFQEEYVPAEWLIDQVRMKYHVVGGMSVSGRNGNVFVNHSNASAADMIQLIRLVKERVLESFGVTLEEDIIYLGF